MIIIFGCHAHVENGPLMNHCAYSWTLEHAWVIETRKQNFKSSPLESRCLTYHLSHQNQFSILLDCELCYTTLIISPSWHLKKLDNYILNFMLQSYVISSYRSHMIQASPLGSLVLLELNVLGLSSFVVG